MLTNKRILVVEDEYFIASDLKRMLEGEGAVPLGLVGDLAQGLALAEQPLDAAILDVNLGEVFSYPIADRLRSRGVPYLFLTGYDGWSLPEDHRHTARISKPFSAPSVVNMVEDLLFQNAKVT